MPRNRPSLTTGIAGSIQGNDTAGAWFKGVLYDTAPAIGRPLSAADLGPEYARVRCEPPSDARSCESFLTPDTPVYTVQRYSPSFRLAARVADTILLLEATESLDAQHGSDLLDLKGKVKRITIHRGHPHDTPAAATIDDPTTITTLVGLIETGSIDRTRRVPGRSGYYLLFTFIDDTQSMRYYDRDARRLAQWIVVPDAFEATMSRVLTDR
ncbi:MAG: hypothetical protein NVSMB42_18990 [Herpetosiphon sp.]